MSIRLPLEPSECHIQQAVIQWWKLAHKGLGVADERSLMANPLQGKRSLAEGRRRKSEGMRKGMSDLFLAVPRAGFHGLWLELKKPGGRIAPEQVEFIEAMRAQGYGGAFTEGFENSIAVIKIYLQQVKPS